jgi:opacity protein-like surface antigen
MKSRVMLFVLLLTLAGAVCAADVTGKWTAQVPGREGQTRETTFTFKVEGDKLTGTVSGRQNDNPISDGKVKGDEISFTVKMSFGGNDVVLNYKGKVAGEEIKFSRTREGADQAQEFTAKRAK